MTGQLSEDGLWEWDGTGWVPSAQQLGSSDTGTDGEPVSGRVAKKLEKAAAKVAAAADVQARAALSSPPGRARTAYERGDHVFQCSFDVLTQQAIVVSMVGASTKKQLSDPTDILNAVCSEGWELLTGSFVFVEEGQQSRDKFMSSGQNVATKGKTMGYYLFKRCPENRQSA